MPSVGRAQDLVEAGVDRRAAVEVEQQVAHRGRARFAEVDAQARLGQRQRLLGDDALARADHTRGQRVRRRVGDAPGLAEHAHRRLDHRRGQGVDRRRQHQRVGRQRHAPVRNAEREAQLARRAVVRVEPQVGRLHLPRAQRHEAEHQLLRVPRPQRRDRLRCGTDELWHPRVHPRRASPSRRWRAPG